MTERLKIYTAEQREILVRKRAGETRLGEKVQTLKENKADTLTEQLLNSSARYVLLGIPEDIGVRANFGRAGAYSAWTPAVTTIMNVQSNSFLRGDELLLLGHIDCSDLMTAASELDMHDDAELQKARQLVSEIDNAVAPVAEEIIKAGKELIVIGGGHNNAYPLLKGASTAKGKSINCLNCDAHSDLRPAEGRHSGNAFTYAIAGGYLNKYAVAGLHEMFSPDQVTEKIGSKSGSLKAITFEDIFIREKMEWKEAIRECITFIGAETAGLELDIDQVQNIPSSAKTSSGISTIQARQYVHEAAVNLNLCYFHIAEAAPVLSHIKTDLKTGKLIAYLVTDYIKARNSKQ